MQIEPLSGSVGGAPILLDQPTLPGTVIHENQADSGYVDRLQNLWVGNPNSNQVTLFVQALGPGVPDQIVRVDIPSTAEGMDIRELLPVTLGPGYSYHVAAQLQTDNIPLYLFGEVVRSETGSGPVTDLGGLGGLSRVNPVTFAGGSIGLSYAPFPWELGAINDPENVVQDPINDRFQLEVAGIWYVSVFVNLSFTSSNSGRTTFIQFYDQTADFASEDIPVYAGRDQDGLDSTVSLLVDVGEDIVGNWFQIRLGGGSSFSSVMAEAGELSLIRVGST